ncbi:hypothetical protein MIR68_011357 [Amoeboaphelidium protococcarum]|nr:hypothetical protein MIR68_011357 [Amoeboaphelidium protococcarum]
MSSLAAKQTPSTSATASIPVFSTTIGASIDAFYRSGMNSLLNQRLTKLMTQSTSVISSLSTPPAKIRYFPNMHYQLPTRILYINGIKSMRVYVERQKATLYQNGTIVNPWQQKLIETTAAIIPGLTMTPLSSLLEAFNAGHMNKEHLLKRATRGFVPRSIREVIFAIGLNQASDVMTSSSHLLTLTGPLNAMQMKLSKSDQAETINSFAGSICAGVIAGYISHVPHNLSTLKLLNPSVSYYGHFQTLLSAGKVQSAQSPTVYDNILRTVKTFVLPKGVQIRTLQITGSFVIINGVIAICKSRNFEERLAQSIQIKRVAL